MYQDFCSRERHPDLSQVALPQLSRKGHTLLVIILNQLKDRLGAIVTKITGHDGLSAAISPKVNPLIRQIILSPVLYRLEVIDYFFATGVTGTNQYLFLHYLTFLISCWRHLIQRSVFGGAFLLRFSL